MSDLLKTALTQYGIKEIPGNKNNPEVLKYFNIIQRDVEWTDEYAWCSAFINWCCIKTGKPASQQLNARSWLNIGKPVQHPLLGDIVIYWRVAKNDWRGHVGLYINEIDGQIYTLGGNQNNMVCIKPYPAERLLGYRRV